MSTTLLREACRNGFYKGFHDHLQILDFTNPGDLQLVDAEQPLSIAFIDEKGLMYDAKPESWDKCAVSLSCTKAGYPACTSGDGIVVLLIAKKHALKHSRSSKMVAARYSARHLNALLDFNDGDTASLVGSLPQRITLRPVSASQKRDRKRTGEDASKVKTGRNPGVNRSGGAEVRKTGNRIKNRSWTARSLSAPATA